MIAKVEKHTPKMSNNIDDPNSPSSALSKKARLAHWITGGTNRGPSTMSSFTRMARDRNDIKKATEAWDLASKCGLNEHQGQWGRSGVVGALDQASGSAPRPRGTALIRWIREGGGRGERGAGPGDAAAQSEMQQQGRQGQGEAGPSQDDMEDDIYGADDATTGARIEGGNAGDGDMTAGTPTGNASGQEQTAEGDNDHHQEGGPARPAQQSREQTADR